MRRSQCFFSATFPSARKTFAALGVSSRIRLRSRYALVSGRESRKRMKRRGGPAPNQKS